VHAPYQLILPLGRAHVEVIHQLSQHRTGMPDRNKLEIGRAGRQLTYLNVPVCQMDIS
jgi:hypothetical protein